MDFQIALILGQDGITNGAIYALLALALVLVFAVTRVIFIPQGEFVAYGALTLAMIGNNVFPATAWLLLGAGVAVAALDGLGALRAGQVRKLPRVLAVNVGYPLAVIALLRLLPLAELGLAVQILLAMLVVVPLGPMMYRIVYQPIAEATVLVLLIVSVASHVAMVGLGLLFFGAEGYRTPPLSDARFDLGSLSISGQTIWVVAASIVLSGVLISPITTIYYDTGFLIGLKGFVAAIFGGLASYPMALVGALLVGQLEAFASFWASAYKEVLVFTLIVPVLWWRSLNSHHVEDEE